MDSLFGTRVHFGNYAGIETLLTMSHACEAISWHCPPRMVTTSETFRPEWGFGEPKGTENLVRAGVEKV